jgi:cysteine desulfurase / selenocysteine lyase
MIETQTFSLKGEALYKKIRHDFIGLDTEYLLANGEKTRRVYFDSTASTLMMGPALRTAERFLEHYSNTHSEMHFGAKICTQTYNWVHQKVLDFVKADSKEYTCFFTGSGVTSGMNRMARVFGQIRPDKNIILISIMEHHSNDLPHRKHGGQVVHIPLDTHDSNLGCVNLQLLEKYLSQYKDKVSYVSVTGISNVTGIFNPMNKIASLAHQYGTHIIVDAAQMASHSPIKMSGHNDSSHDIDSLIFSGHKTYAPGSPGVVIARKSILSATDPDEVGGGMVDRVYENSYVVKSNFPDREEAGTPNILGAIILGASIEILDRIGMDYILKKDLAMTNELMAKMIGIPDMVIYGDTDTVTCPRAASISFNIVNMDHGLVAAILNDYYNIAVRNECFCAHPYVEKMLEQTHSNQIKGIKNLDNPWHIEPWMGMVRVSLGLYNTREDLDYFASALNEIVNKKEWFKNKYNINENGDYIHSEFRFSGEEYFNLTSIVEEELKK